MSLQGRDLKLDLSGDDGLLLQTELRQLGFTIQDRDGFFGANITQQAVRQFHEQHGLEATGVVARINAEVDATQEEAPRFVVQGQILGADDQSLGGGRVAVHAVRPCREQRNAMQLALILDRRISCEVAELTGASLRRDYEARKEKGKGLDARQGEFS